MTISLRARNFAQQMIVFSFHFSLIQDICLTAKTPKSIRPKKFVDVKTYFHENW